MEIEVTSNAPSLRTILRDETAILCIPTDIDVQVAYSTYLNGVAAQIWEHAQYSVLMHDNSDPSSQLWARTRQQKL